MNQQLIKFARIMEITIAVLVMISIGISIGIVIFQSIQSLVKGSFNLEGFLSSALTLVVGVEFVKMLLLHTPESVIEVLLYAVARQIILSHDSALENLIGVLAVAIIFIVRTYLITKKSSIEKTDKNCDRII